MIIWRIPSLANDHPEDPASCNCLSGGSSHLQMIIRRNWPFANHHPEDLATCKWSSGGTGLLQMIIRHPNHFSQDLNLILRTFKNKLLVFSLNTIRWMSDKFFFAKWFWIPLMSTAESERYRQQWSKSPIKSPQIETKNTLTAWIRHFLWCY